ncbi:restriction endonuclease subunit S [Micromonospora sp. WMMD975]|uniref:restriction endonuclease subunit S n=1 Tax=Micromonospora sp. WMMD975 TaxID=3016087 RepID=UPI00249A3057|nr:restriction endonuclease subunit S [Micromonospora sp. WMMD975]WFE35589.1 restriction endonuclease subunit S [Micromonospora sp. WMMD975]
MIDSYAHIPAHWKLSRVDRVATVSARIGWKALTAAEYQPDGFAFLATPNIKSRTIDFENVNFISGFRYHESPELKLAVGDVLLAKDGNTLGIVNLVRSLPRPATVNGSIAVLRPFAVHPAYLLYVLAGDATQQSIALLKGGMGVPHLFQWDIRRLRIPLPPMDEQRRIASFLDAQTDRLNSLIAGYRRKRRLLDEQLEAMRDKLFVDHAGVRMTPLMHLTDPRRPIVYGIVQAGPEVPGGVPYIKTGDLPSIDVSVLSTTSPEIHAQYRRASVVPGDIIMAMRASIGAVGVVPGNLSEANLTQGTARIAGRKGVDKRWLFHALQTRAVRDQCDIRAVGSTFRTLNIWDLRRICLPLVSSVEQARMAEKFDEVLYRHGVIASKLERQIALLQERTRSLIAAAVQGQIDVTTAQEVDL